MDADMNFDDDGNKLEKPLGVMNFVYDDIEGIKKNK